MPKETVCLTEIEVELLATFIRRKILSDTAIADILADLADKLNQ